MKKIVTLVIMMVLLIAAPASSSPTEAESLAIADRWAAQFPQHENHCSGGRLRITWDSARVESEAKRAGIGGFARGFADGWTWTGTEHVWDYTRCTVTIRADLPAADRCWVVAHELMHYVIGPEHVGPLDPEHPGAIECYRQPTAKPKRKRSRREIARSIKFRKTMARIHARQANG